jgi:1,4-dihydroxy-2-naphthoate octaprenyltransferase
MGCQTELTHFPRVLFFTAMKYVATICTILGHLMNLLLLFLLWLMVRVLRDVRRKVRQQNVLFDVKVQGLATSGGRNHRTSANVAP